MAANDSCALISPHDAMTMSGSSPRSVLNCGQMPAPLVQCSMASSIDRYCRCSCLSDTITLT